MCHIYIYIHTVTADIQILVLVISNNNIVVEYIFQIRTAFALPVRVDEACFYACTSHMCKYVSIAHVNVCIAVQDVFYFDFERWWEENTVLRYTLFIRYADEVIRTRI